MTRHRDHSGLFWGFMLVAGWMLAPALTMLAQLQARSGNADHDKLFHAALFMAVFLAGMSLVAIRILIGRAIDQEQFRLAKFLGVLSALTSAGLIAYGLSYALS